VIAISTAALVVALALVVERLPQLWSEWGL